MTIARFASIETALSEIQQARQSGRLQAAIGLARRALGQFPGQAELHSLLAELYGQTGQHALARPEKMRAEQLAAHGGRMTKQPVTPGPEGSPDGSPERTASAPRPRSRSLLAVLLPASALNPAPSLPPVPPQQQEELLKRLDPLVRDFVHLEADLADRPDIPEETRVLIRESRKALKESQTQLHLFQAAKRAGGDSPVTFVSNLGPAGQSSFRSFTSRGPEVLALQKILKRENIPVSLSGVYDALTQKAVYILQERHGIKRTGVVDAETRELLNRLAGRSGGQPVLRDEV